MMQYNVSLLVCFLLSALFFAIPAPANADANIKSGVDISALPKKKQTTFGLYVTAKEAVTLLGERDDIVLIDVRAPSETNLVGYPVAAAANIPYMLVDPGLAFDAKKGRYKFVRNADFVSDVRAFMKTPKGQSAKTLLFMCRSGARSAMSVNALAKAGGFENVYSVIDGFEGDKDANGKRTINGWKNSGAPWTTKVTEKYWFGRK